MQKISTIVLYVIAIISVVLAGLFFFGPTKDYGAHSDVPVFTDLNLLWAVVLFIATVVITFVFAIENIATHPKALKRAVISLIAAGVLVLVSYILASGDPVGGRAEDISGSTLKWVGTGLIATYILGGIAIVGIIASEVYRAFK